MEQAKKKAVEEQKIATKSAEEQTLRLAKSSEAIDAVSNKANNKHAEIATGAAAGAKAMHVATATISVGSGTVTIDKESLSDLEKMVALNEDQAGFLSSIDSKIGKNRYNRNDASHSEVTSTIWGN